MRKAIILFYSSIVIVIYIVSIIVSSIIIQLTKNGLDQSFFAYALGRIISDFRYVPYIGLLIPFSIIVNTICITRGSSLKILRNILLIAGILLVILIVLATLGGGYGMFFVTAIIAFAPLILSGCVLFFLPLLLLRFAQWTRKRYIKIFLILVTLILTGLVNVYYFTYYMNGNNFIIDFKKGIEKSSISKAAGNYKTFVPTIKPANSESKLFPQIVTVPKERQLVMLGRCNGVYHSSNYVYDFSIVYSIDNARAFQSAEREYLNRLSRPDPAYEFQKTTINGKPAIIRIPKNELDEGSPRTFQVIWENLPGKYISISAITQCFDSNYKPVLNGQIETQIRNFAQDELIKIANSINEAEVNNKIQEMSSK